VNKVQTVLLKIVINLNNVFLIALLISLMLSINLDAFVLMILNAFLIIVARLITAVHARIM
jgi:hypothetical protein